MSSSAPQALAVLAMACRFPGADSPAAFWQNLANGVESVQPIPATRWSTEDFFIPPPYQPGKSISQWGAFLDDIQRFDAARFGISPAEANIMDPQQRILLELADETLANAGYTNNQSPLRIGVFLGIGQNGYSELTVPLLLSGQPTHPSLVANNIRNLIAGQIAHSLNLTGPALVIDTACSSSLVALHLARQSLLAGDCDLALVGGINLNITATPFVAFSSAGVLSATPHTYAFDERADGFVLGEGGGMILLSTLARAQAMQDPILGLVRGSAINNDGRSLGTMTPSPAGQEAVLRAAYASAALDPATISYIEAHGTATRIGDLVEARALTRFFRTAPATGPRYLGTVKTNVGHLLSAAGMPSLIKVLLALQNRQVPPTLHTDQLRPGLKLTEAGFTLNSHLVDWPTPDGQPRRAGINGFGFGGTNAHILLEEAPPGSVAHPAEAQPAPIFARTRYWVDAQPVLPPAVLRPASQSLPLPTADSTVDSWFQQVVWAATTLPARIPDDPCRSWLILATETAAAQQLAQALAEHLQIQGVACTYAGADQSRAHLTQTDLTACGLVWIGPVGPTEPLESRAALDTALAQGVLTLYQVAQHLVTQPATQRPAGMWVITAGAQAVEAGEGPVAPDRAALAGLAFALNSEKGVPPCTVIDLPPTNNLATQLSLLSAELGSPPRGDLLAWRRVAGQWTRFARQVENLPTAAPDNPSRTLRKGAYLITGGASGIGAALARSLAEQDIPLILTGRTPLLRSPERATLIATLRKAGATVDYVVADVTQAEEVTALFDYIEQLYGAPTGIIHAAGVVQPQSLRSKTALDFQTVLAPKVAGGWLLLKEIQRRAIGVDCFVLFSSVASILPGLGGGLSDYTAANAFLDALASLARHQGIPCTVLNWPAWTETGMGAHPHLLAYLTTYGLAGLRTEEGVRAFYRALALDLPQVVICKPAVQATRSEKEETASAYDEPTVLPLAQPSSETSAIERTLQTLLAPLLQLEPEAVSTQRSFMSLGIDSMDALDLVQKLEQAGFGGLPATLFFEYQTIADLARHLAGQSPTTAPVTESVTESEPAALTSFPLTPIQQAFAINHYLYPDRPAVAFLRQTIVGTIQVEWLTQAIRTVAARHPLLRTRFAMPGGETTLQQTVYPVEEPGILPELEVYAAAEEAGLAHWENEQINRPFDLVHERPWRIALVADRRPNHWHLLLAIHHIAGDAWSLSLVAQELWQLYTALHQGHAPDLTLPHTTYQSYQALQHNQSLAPATQAWWREKIKTYAAGLPLILPFDQASASFTLDDGERTENAAYLTQLTPELTHALTQLAAQAELSLFHLLLAVYLRTVAEWSKLTYLIVNVADAQRPTQPPGLMQVVGSFADTLPLGLAIPAAESTLLLAQRIRQEWLAIQQHKAISSLALTRLLAEAVSSQDTTEPRTFSPLGFSFARFPVQPPRNCPIEVIELGGRTATATMRLSLVGWEWNGALAFTWNYLTPLFAPATITALATTFVQELTSLVANDSIGTMPAAPPPFLPVHTQVRAQCQRTPDAQAVWDHATTLTYRELDQLSDQVAAALYQLGVTTGARIGLLATPSAEAVILLLGIAKANATWVPLDPAHPPARLADQLHQAEVEHLVFPDDLATTAHAIGAALHAQCHLHPLTTLHQTDGHPPSLHTAPEAIAYIIFTSGSTGRPKGVPITHASLANYLGWAVDTFGYSPADRVMQATSLCFDASLRQLFAPLVTGGTVVPVDRLTVADPDALLDFIQQTQLTIWSSAPALWGRLLGAIEKRLAKEESTPALPALRWIQVGGEALPAHLVRRWWDLYGNRQQIVNLYGPTETTINATYYIIPNRPADDETQIPIGVPVRGSHLQVIDATGIPCPPGVPGELYIGGCGLTPGYLNDTVQTQQQFIEDSTGQRFYRSGDRVQQQADGNLLFLGRVDDQVKVRGYRIELGEIEAVLSQHAQIHLSAVLLRPRATDTPAAAQADEHELVAYLESTEPPDEATLRQWVQRSLPAYMVPHHFYYAARLPLTPNGKVDRHTLAAGEFTTQPLPRRADTLPQTATELLLARIWQTVLGTTQSIGRDDDFFVLGGDSLQVIRVFAELEKIRAPLPRATYLYRYRTLAALAQAFDHYQPEPASAPPATAPATDTFSLTLAQAGFLLLRAGQAEQATSWCARFALDGPLDVACFTQAMDQLVARHLMLRVIFPSVNAASGTRQTPYQREITPDAPLPVTFQDLQALPDRSAQQDALERCWQILRARRFDPSQWPLVEMHLYRLTPTEHIWFVATDHLIGDGWSGWLLGQELLQLYDALFHKQPVPLPPLRSTFRDYVALQQQHERHPDPAAEAYWRERFATPYQPPILRRETKGTKQSVHQSIELDAALVSRLEAYAATEQVTPYEVLLTLFLCQLYRWTGQADLVVGSALAGRDEALPDIMRIFGAFATALPLRIQLANAPWREQLHQVAAAFGRARAHTLSPRRIAQLIPAQSTLSAAIGAQFLFSYMDFTALGDLHSDSLRVRWRDSQTELHPPGVGTDLILTARKLEGELRLFFMCPAQVLDAQALARFAHGFYQALRQQIDQPAPSAIHVTSTPFATSPAGAPLHAALIGYLPPLAQIQTALGAVGNRLEANQIRKLVFPTGDARWIEQVATPLGTSGLIALPYFADELATLPPAQLVQASLSAVEQATTLGAQVVSLAGMLPAYTRYGYALLEPGQPHPLPLTTGHSTTVVAVVKSVIAALAALDQPLATQVIGCLGLGSIGSAALQLLLQTADHPAGLILCDVKGSADRLHALAATLRREFDYQGRVDIIEGEATLPTELYQADLIIGATSRPNLLEIARLRPGTVVVDDSFPPCFAVEAALARMTTAQDVLVIGGGLLQCGAMQRTIQLPLASPGLGEQLAGQILPDAIASCQVEALLWRLQPTLPLTHGVATLSLARSYWAAATAWGIEAAPLHLQTFRIEAPLLQQIRHIRQSG